MTIYIQGLSALAHYRSSDATTEPERCPRSIAALDSAVSSRAACTAARVWRMGIDEPTVDCPLEVLVRDKSQRSRSKAVIARVWGKPIARTAFRRASKDVYVSSPEFVFLQLATRLDLLELVALGMELCGTYRRNVKVPVLGTNDTELITLYQQKPLTNPKRLGSFIKSMPSTPGHARAMTALGSVHLPWKRPYTYCFACRAGSVATRCRSLSSTRQSPFPRRGGCTPCAAWRSPISTGKTSILISSTTATSFTTKAVARLTPCGEKPLSAWGSKSSS